jgi:hypothetical protein
MPPAPGYSAPVRLCGSSAPTTLRRGDRPIYPRWRASLSLLETAEDLPTRRRCAISGGNLKVAIWDVAPVSGGPSRHRLLLRARQRVDVRR